MANGRVALITGASRGIGASAAEHFADAGYRVALVATSDESLRETIASVERRGAEALTLGGDLADLKFVHDAVRQTIDRFGRVDVLVNKAATREMASMRRISLESWEHTLRVCLTAPAFLSRWAAEDMRRRSSGIIINISSIMATQVAGVCPAYLAAKGGLDVLTYELASLYGPDGIRVVGVQPGAIDTELSRQLVDDDGSEQSRAFSEDMIMLRRWAEPAEIARLIVFLASDAASYITATNIVADGGWTRQHFPLSLKRRQFPKDFE